MSVSSPLLKELKRHILALSQPANNYAIPINTYPSQESGWNGRDKDNFPHSSWSTRGLFSTGASSDLEICGSTTPTNSAASSRKKNYRQNSRDSLSSSPECLLSLNRLSFEPYDYWGTESSELMPNDVLSNESEPSNVNLTSPSDECNLSPTPCTSHPLSPQTNEHLNHSFENLPLHDGHPTGENGTSVSESSPAKDVPKFMTDISRDIRSSKGSEDATSRFVSPSIGDAHPSLAPLCSTLEAILSDGLQEGQSTPFGYHKCSFWQWMSQIKDKCVGQYPGAVNAVLRCSALKGADARGRLLIRYCLQHGCLQVPLITKLKQDSLASFYSPNSILGHEILAEIFLSLVRQIDTLTFDLDLENWGFLDTSWHLPAICSVELNPCIGLGIQLGHVAGRSVVLRVELNGAAHKSGCVHTGDVICAINGKSIHGFNRHCVSQLLKEAKATSTRIRLKIAKGMDRNGRVYPPVLSLLIKLGIDLEDARERRIVEEDLCSAKPEFSKSRKKTSPVGPKSPLIDKSGMKSNTSDSLCASPSGQAGRDSCGHNYQSIEDQPSTSAPRVWLVGSVEVGSRGDVDLISDAVLTVLRKSELSQHMPVEFVTGEIGVKVLSQKGKTLLQHSYTEISACGRRESQPLYFAYLAGDTTCSLSAQFTCFVFRAATLEESSEILLTLADGFHRTHWAV